jgi:hypothetical protein
LLNKQQADRVSPQNFPLLRNDQFGDVPRDGSISEASFEVFASTQNKRFLREKKEGYKVTFLLQESPPKTCSSIKITEVNSKLTVVFDLQKIALQLMTVEEFDSLSFRYFLLPHLHL